MNHHAAGAQRLEALTQALGFPDADGEAMGDLDTADHRRSELVAREILKHPDRYPIPRGGRTPEVRDGGPRTGEQFLLWDLCGRYEHVAGVIEVYVGDERVLRYPVANLRQDARLN